MSEINRKDYFKKQSKKYYSIPENKARKLLLTKIRAQEKPEEVRKQQKCWEQSLKGRLSTYKSRSKFLHLEFSLTIDQFQELTNSKCVYCDQYSKNKNFCRCR